VEICGKGNCGDFAVVAVTQDETLKNLFLDMGADVVVWGDKTCQPSIQDFLKAYEKTGAKEIFVFPNSKNSNLAAVQGGDLYQGGKVTVFETKSVAECYAALSMIDFEAEDKAELADEIRQIMADHFDPAGTKVVLIQYAPSGNM
jgi:dihydroxyacetone kinase-like predicted kinase